MRLYEREYKNYYNNLVKSKLNKNHEKKIESKDNNNYNSININKSQYFLEYLFARFSFKRFILEILISGAFILAIFFVSNNSFIENKIHSYSEAGFFEEVKVHNFFYRILNYEYKIEDNK